jgi:hypothetical protein
LFRKVYLYLIFNVFCLLPVYFSFFLCFIIFFLCTIKRVSDYFLVINRMHSGQHIC